jgi:beta-glucanase (GH16 family)
MIKVISAILLVFALHSVQSQPNNRNVVVAHRGAWKANNLPENSIASLTKAVEMKCAGSEFDVRMTADNVLVVNHDSDFFGLEIEKVKYEALTAHALKNGEKIPTLASYLLAGVRDHHSTRLVLEIKPSEISKERGRSIAREVIRQIRYLKLEDKVDYISFDIDILKELISINPKISTQYLNGDRSPRELKEIGISGLDYHYKVFYKNPQWIQQAKDIKMTLNVWTVNDAKDMDFFLTQNFDYITTNEPELLANKIHTYTLASEWKLIWSDEFDHEGLPDENKWSYDIGGHGWGNNEKQYYLAKSKENSIIKDGKLHIIALKKDFEQSNYTSAKLTTYQKLDIQYGKIEVKAKLPKGKGSWPAIWMLPGSIRTKAEHWPLCGEIDIMEHVGKDPNVVHTSLHTELYNHIKGTQITFFDTLQNVFDEYHTYGIEWDEKSIRFIYDGKPYFESYKGQNGRVSTNEGWPFDKPYFLILNVAVGGNWGGAIDEHVFPYEMVVDYVRVYKKE